MSTRTAVEDLLGRIGTGDPDLVAQAYADEVDWRLDWPEDQHGADVPWIRPARAGVEIDFILVDGDDAVVMGTLSNTLRHNGAAYRAHFALHLSVQDGLVTRHHVYEDSLAVARAWAAPERVVS
jgi:ketosteroid isomerase-like protein